MHGNLRPIPPENIREVALSLLPKVLPKQLHRQATDEAARMALGYIVEQRKAKRDNTISHVPYYIVRLLARKAAANAMRESPPQSKRAPPKRERTASSFELVASQLSLKHQQALQMKKAGKKLREIASELGGVRKEYVGQLLNSIDLHHAHYLSTGTLPPRAQHPTVANRRRATALVALLLPNLPKNEVAKHVRITALALGNKLPRHKQEIDKLRKIVNRKPGDFPEEIRNAVKKRKPLTRRIKPIMHLIAKAAERGDKGAQSIAGKNPQKWHYRTVRELLNRRGLSARHPDLFLGTQFAPHNIQNIHRKSLETKKREIQELVNRGEKSGTAMKLYLQGHNLEEVARRMKLSKSRANHFFDVGTHAVFGVQPRGTDALLEYEELRKRHADIF